MKISRLFLSFTSLKHIIASCGSAARRRPRWASSSVWARRRSFDPPSPCGHELWAASGRVKLRLIWTTPWRKTCNGLQGVHCESRGVGEQDPPGGAGGCCCSAPAAATDTRNRVRGRKHILAWTLITCVYDFKRLGLFLLLFILKNIMSYCGCWQLDRPLVAGCSIGLKPCLLHVSRWDLN